MDFGVSDERKKSEEKIVTSLYAWGERERERERERETEARSSGREGGWEREREREREGGRENGLVVATQKERIYATYIQLVGFPGQE